MLPRFVFKVRFLLVVIVVLALAHSFAQAFDCERPHLQQNLGMCVDVARSRLTSKTESDTRWDNLSAAVQASPEMGLIFECVDQIISTEAYKPIHRNHAWTMTVPALALQNCNAVNEFQQHVRGVSRAEAAKYMCSSAYILLENYIGPSPDMRLVLNAVSACTSVFVR